MRMSGILTQNNDIKWRLLLWMMSLIATIVLSLTGLVYSNLSDRVKDKADKTQVDSLEKKVDEVQKGVDLLLEMHVKAGMGIPGRR